MVSVHDVAAYILQVRGQMSAMNLQKLVYYSQAWSLVRDGRPLFPERIEAWANGPVVRRLYAAHRKLFLVGPEWALGDASNIGTEGKASIDVVLEFYGDKPPDWLSQLTHREKPWIDARKGLLPGQSGTREITHAAMAEYYSSLV